MALLCYLRPADKSSSSSTSSREVECEVPVPKVHNEVCSQVQDVQDRGKKRGEYQKFTVEERATIGKYASEHGVASVVRKFKGKNLKDSSVRDWQNL